MANENQLPLDGLEIETRDGRPTTSMRNAVAITIAALHEEGLLAPRHTAMCQLALVLADAVERGASSGRASAAAMAAGQLLATLEALPAPSATTSEDKFNEFVKQLEAAANAVENMPKTDADADSAPA